jgi:hypothetical protein
MMRQVVQIAPVAALLAIGMPAPGATAASVVPALQSDEAITLVGEDRRRGGERGHRSERRGDRDRSDRGDRERGARTFDRDDDRDRRFRRNRDGRDIWYGFGPTYDDCDWLRRRARAEQSDYWWRRYRQCVQRW